jgi:transposase
MEAKFADVPDELWNRVAPLLPGGPGGGRSRKANRPIFAGVVYRLKTGCQWKALPREFGSGSTVHRRFAEWCKLGIFTLLFAEMLRFYEATRGIEWQWSALDGFMGKAPKGGT